MEDEASKSARLGALACYRHAVDRIQSAWPEFLGRRAERLKPHPLFADTLPEKVTEGILEDLFTTVLDWPVSNLSPQVQRADFVLSDHGIRWMIVEAKRPGALSWNRRAVECALAQAIAYAVEQNVRRVAVSDGGMLYAADLVNGCFKDRVFVSLCGAQPELDLWWLSMQGIWRDRELTLGAGGMRLLCEEPLEHSPNAASADGMCTLLHPKYKLPAHCFGYIGSALRPQTWKLPYLLADGTVDLKRLPKAVQSILSNYRGTRVQGIPEEAIPTVLTRLAWAARRTGHLGPEVVRPADVYKQLAVALEQLGITLEMEE